MAYNLYDCDDPTLVLGDLPNLCAILAQRLKFVSNSLLMKVIVSRGEEVKRENESLNILENKMTLMKKLMRKKPLKFIRKLKIRGLKIVKRDLKGNVLKQRKWKCLTLLLWKLKFIAFGKIVDETEGWATIFKAELRELTREASQRNRLVIENTDELQAVEYMVKRAWGFSGSLIINQTVIGYKEATTLNSAALAMNFSTYIHSLPEQKPLTVGARSQWIKFAAEVREGARRQ